MKSEILFVGGHAANFAWSAFRSFVATLAVLTLAGIVLAAISYFWLSEFHWIYRVIAAVVAFAEAVAVGVFLGGKRGLVVATAERLGTLRLGGAMVRLIFERILKISAEQTFGERGGAVGQSLERVPLAKADELLSRAVRGVTGDAAQVGWFRRTLQWWLLKAVRACTLARFREEGARHGGVDLMKVKAELEETIDDMVVKKVRSGMWAWTAMALVGLPLLVAGQNWVATLLLTRKE